MSLKYQFRNIMVMLQTRVRHGVEQGVRWGSVVYDRERQQEYHENGLILLDDLPRNTRQ